jgi:hypothetical protein
VKPAKFGEWTRVEDALPEAHGNYLAVFIDRRHNERHISIAGYGTCHGANDEWVTAFYARLSFGGAFASDVTHWMPLPEPPEAA